MSSEHFMPYKPNKYACRYVLKMIKISQYKALHFVLKLYHLNSKLKFNDNCYMILIIKKLYN